MKLITKIIMLLAVAMLISTMAIATASASPDIKSDKTNTGISIESKEKKVSYKITWNSNGGKIGTKKTKITTVKKGSKIGKLVATPKRSGYKFSGWYTKKTGGKKVTVNTKPTKSVTFYAKWTKKSSSRVLTAEEKKLVGSWFLGSVSGGAYNSYTGAYLHATGLGSIQSFNADGSYNCVGISNTAYSKYAFYTKGFWHMSGGTVYITGKQYQDTKDGGTTWSSWKPSSTPNDSMKIIFGSDEIGSYFQEGYEGAKWRKS